VRKILDCGSKQQQKSHAVLLFLVHISAMLVHTAYDVASAFNNVIQQQYFFVESLNLMKASYCATQIQ